MNRNKYLEDIGIFDDEVGSDTELRQKQRELYGFDNREVFNLDRTFAKWLYSRLRLYLETADAVGVYMDYVVRKKGKKRTTFREEILEILALLKRYLVGRGSTATKTKLIRKAAKRLARIVQMLWI